MGSYSKIFLQLKSNILSENGIPIKEVEVLNRSEANMNQEILRKAVNYYSFLKMIWRESLTRDENGFK